MAAAVAYWWSWGESNPRPSAGECAWYDHSRCGAVATPSAGRLSSYL